MSRSPAPLLFSTPTPQLNNPFSSGLQENDARTALGKVAVHSGGTVLDALVDSILSARRSGCLLPPRFLEQLLGLPQPDIPSSSGESLPVPRRMSISVSTVQSTSPQVILSSPSSAHPSSCHTLFVQVSVDDDLLPFCLLLFFANLHSPLLLLLVPHPSLLFASGGSEQYPS